MPTYQYACTSCGERLEVVQKFSDDPLTVCPACSGALRKVFSPVGVVFKGSGFYKTDSRSTGRSGGSSSAASSTAGSSAESKPNESGTAASTGDSSSAGSAASAGSGGSGGSGGKDSGGSKDTSAA